MNNKTGFIVINFVSGKKQKFEFIPVATDTSSTGTRLERMMALGHLMLQCDDRVHIIPLANVESIEVSPAPDNKVHVLAVQAIREL